MEEEDEADVSVHSDGELQLEVDEDGRILFGGALDSSFRVYDGVLPAHTAQTLLQDCASAFTARAKESDDMYSSGQTYWVPADAVPKSALEHLALDIFRRHTRDVTFDPARSGAEWWTQHIDIYDEIGLHFDKDYVLESSGVNICPHLGTVTYLCDVGAQ
jgi:hypothetical protein